MTHSGLLDIAELEAELLAYLGLLFFMGNDSYQILSFVLPGWAEGTHGEARLVTNSGLLGVSELMPQLWFSSYGGIS